MRLTLALLIALLFAHAAEARPIVPPSPARASEIERRIDDLIARMTIEEKAGQLNMISKPDGPPPIEAVRRGEIGAFLNVIEPSEIEALRRAARESRLGLPVMFGLDAVHGYRTIFPLPIGQASTWNMDLVERAAFWTGHEAFAVGIDQTFAPMVDMSRDPRWGRVLEGGGEDVHLNNMVSAARTRGYQRGGVAATVKHFVGYGAGEGGRDYNSTWIPTSQLFDFHIPPFQAAIEAGSLTVMAAFNALNGVPATAHRGMLTDVLRGRLGYDGFVVSDFNSIGELVMHGVAEDPADAARLAILAGIDMDMEGTVYLRFLPRLVAEGKVPMAVVDEAVRRVLRVKFRLGLFERQPIDIAGVVRQLETPAARADALQVARESLVLLTNRDEILPLRPEARRIALVGPLATYKDDRPWTGPGYMEAPPVENVLEALVRLAPGRVFDEIPALADRCGHTFLDREAAIRRAREADVIVAVLGEDCEEIGEAASRVRLGLPGVQDQLLADLVATGKPVVLVLKTGRPKVLSWHARHMAAILQTFHPGIEGRSAIAEVLLGIFNPSGKVVMSYPRAEGQIPVYHDHLPTGRPLLTPTERFKSRYLDERNDPLFVFGHGLSYTRFAISDLVITTPRVAVDGTLEARVTVTNIGVRPGQEVVQFYARQLVASRSRPVRQLVAFDKVMLGPGESRTLTLRVPASRLGFHDDEGRFRVEAAPFRLFAGNSSLADLSADFRTVRP